MTADADSRKNRVFIVDDQPLVREWLAHLIGQQSDLEASGEAANASDALRLIGAVKPHVAIVEIAMEGGSGGDIKHSRPCLRSGWRNSGNL